MDRRRFLLTSLAGALAAPLAAPAQSPKRLPRVGVLAPLAPPPAPNPDIDGFRQGLKDLGYVEGVNVALEYRWESGQWDRTAGLDQITELVRLPVDVLVVAGESRVRVASQVAASVPIVIEAAGDPVASGLAATLARPGRNVTGLTLMGVEMSAKRVELLKEAIPGLTKLAILVGPSDRPVRDNPTLRETQTTARRLGIATVWVQVATATGLDGAFAKVKDDRARGLVTLHHPFFATHNERIAALALKARLPIMTGEPGSVEAGALMRYGPDIADLWRRAATHVHKILNGAQPGDLPFEQPTKFELVINLKTAKALGLTIPPSLLARADQVIE